MTLSTRHAIPTVEVAIVDKAFDDLIALLETLTSQ